MNQREQMVQMFDAIDVDGKRFVLAVLRGEFNRVQRARRPALQLVDSRPAAAPALATVTQMPTLAAAGRGK